ncbi:MAG: peptidoglycan-binding domain-containing protein [Pyrinomonadaceae bacterium]
MPRRKVGKGETAISLAKKNGFFWQTIWNHGENAALKEKRKDPTLLHEDDEIFIPEKVQKEVSKGTEAEHTFKLKGDPCKLKLQLLKLGEPRKDEKYVLEIEGKIIEGTTDGDGQIEHFIPSAARVGKLILRDGKESYPIKVGELNPIDGVSGQKQRLNNLGFNCGSENEKVDEKFTEAVKKFQAEYKLEDSGEMNAATKAKLQELSK